VRVHPLSRSCSHAGDAMFYNADEVFEMAEQMERNGHRFYLDAAERAKDVSLARLLKRLADMEKDHEELFAGMRRELAEGTSQLAFDPDSDAVHYLQAVADTQVFNVYGDLAQRLQEAQSQEEVLRLGIALEKESVVYYVGVRDLVPQELGRGNIDWLIEQEMSHVTDLAAQLGKLPS